MRLFRPFDLIPICLIVFIGMGMLIDIGREAGSRADVFVDNRRVATFDLEGSTRVVSIPTRIGPVQIKVGQGEIQVKRSPCSQKICMLRGAIQKRGDQIICLPARLRIAIRGSDTSSQMGNQIDAIAH